jgi:hypothetical protein
MLCPSINRQLQALCLLAMLVMQSAFAKGSERLATMLLEVSGINAIYVQGILAGYKKDAAGTNRPVPEIGCFIARVTPQLTLQPLATGYATEFSDSELQAGIVFFESNAGRRYAQYQRVKSSEMFGAIPKEKAPDLTARDIEVINAFLETRIGKLILSTNSPMSATAKAILKPQLVTYLDQCRKSSVGG